MRRLLIGLVVAATACGGSGSSPGDAAATTVDIDTRFRACAVMAACTGVSVAQCTALLDASATATQLQCVIDAGAGNCVAVRACFGQRVRQDPSCMEGCVDGDTVVQCGDTIRIEQDCPTSLEQVGPSCITNGRTDCGGAACTNDGEITCAGNVVSQCDSGITEVFDCARIGLVCTPTGCDGALGGACTGGASCEGDTAVRCDANGMQRRQSCAAFGRTCVNGACLYGSECAPTTPDTCVGTTFTACLGGVTKSIDCTAIGATMCSGNRCF